ncbi:MAG: InlB B-repeat-containing protein [Clostridia bacterium]|nr:InlB B-repeat-containing protein [Clostridia bacterium]
MKRIAFFVLLVLSLVIAITACGKDDPQTEPTPDEGEPITYTITWVDENGNTLATQNVKEDAVPSYTYNVTDTAEWDYTFNGWSASTGGEALSSIPSATANATYYALVSAVKQVYTVSFNTLGGSAVEPQTVEYGSKAAMPESPTYEGHRFVGWSTSSDDVVEVDFEKAITGNTEYFAVWNKTIDIKGLLSALLSGYELNPYEYLPEAMRSDYSANLVNSEDIVNDYSDFVNVSDITYGFGEQWHMVLENIDQSMVFFNALTVVETISAGSITAFNNYFDKNPQDTAHYEFDNSGYNITISFDGEVLYYVVEYIANIPVIGEVTAQIAMSMIAETGEKSVRIQLGDANALAYTVRENYYDFAIKYLGVRRAMFSIARDNEGSVSGKIYEYLTVSSLETASAAEFYITDGYLSVVGNKADGLVGFSNTICELYDTRTGKMIGYEVNETAEKLGVSVNFDTLWFALNVVDGIDSIKHVTSQDGSETMLYVNGLSTEWESKTVGGFSLESFSRRFDIEFRTQYVTSYDPTTQEYTVHKIQVPMLFIQADYYDTHTDDISSANDSITAEVKISEAELEQLMSDYEELIPVFIENKDVFTVEMILAYIGEKITF